MGGPPPSRSHVQHRGNAGSPTGREPYGDGAPVVVGGRESRSQGEGEQVSGTVSPRGGMRNAERRNLPGRRSRSWKEGSPARRRVSTAVQPRAVPVGVRE